jgi:hypothetical protein
MHGCLKAETFTCQRRLRNDYLAERIIVLRIINHTNTLIHHNTSMAQGSLADEGMSSPIISKLPVTSRPRPRLRLRLENARCTYSDATMQQLTTFTHTNKVFTIAHKRKAESELNGHANGHEAKRIKPSTSPEPEIPPPAANGEDETKGTNGTNGTSLSYHFRRSRLS